MSRQASVCFWELDLKPLGLMQVGCSAVCMVCLALTLLNEVLPALFPTVVKSWTGMGWT